MLPIGKQLKWQELSIGMKVFHMFSVNEHMMQAFAQLSGDNSCIHRDDGFARCHEFKERIVYGALQVAQLSYVCGMLLPGDFGLTTNYQINFHVPLYVNEVACMEAELVHLSEAMNIAKIKFTISVGDRLITTGMLHSKVLEPCRVSDGQKSA